MNPKIILATTLLASSLLASMSPQARIAAMINGTVDIANASRKMKSKEMDLARKNGQTPVEHVVGYDALAVFIHKDNPIKSMSLAQLKDIYGRDPKVTKWSDMGITVPGCKDKIVVVSRQNNSGTYVYFKETVLGKKGRYRQGTLDMHGSKDVVDLVEKTPCAIGYSGLAYATDHLKTVCIATNERGNRQRPQLSHCPPAVHVYQR